MRRVPYIVLKDNIIYYICPKCKHVIPRDLYVIQDWCPTCEHPLNKTSKVIMNVYKRYDKDLYKYFINIVRR